MPRRIGRYELLAPLGVGGMATVYKARDTQLERVVAVKIPHFHGSPRVQQVQEQRFYREARALATIRHPHVCPVYDVGEHAGRPFVVMALIEGETLADCLARQAWSPATVKRQIELLLQVLTALDVIHAHGIIHRDLKPTNILLDTHGQAYVSDFGLAHTREESEVLTSEGVVVGTPAYMAPEQALGSMRDIGPWTDVYAAGVILYQIVVGKLPFAGTALAVLTRIARDAVPPPSSVRNDVDPRLESIILKALARDRRARYQQAAELAHELAEWCRLPPPATAQSIAATPGTTEVMPSVSATAIQSTETDAASIRSSALPAKWGHRLREGLRSVRDWPRSRRVLLGGIACIAVAMLITIIQSTYYGRHDSGDSKNRFVTRENYIRIKPAMSAWEVDEILGSGMLAAEEGLIVDGAGNYRKWNAGMYETGSGLKTAGPIQEIRRQFVWRNGKRAIFVTFLNDRVESKSEEGLYQE